MNGLTVGVVGLIGAVAWLVLLVLSGFNAAVVGAGLLAALAISGSTPSPPHRPMPLL